MLQSSKERASQEAIDSMDIFRNSRFGRGSAGDELGGRGRNLVHCPRVPENQPAAAAASRRLAWKSRPFIVFAT
jgi:hypothetical protein